MTRYILICLKIHLHLYMTKFSKYFTFFTKFFIVLCFEQKAVACVGEKHNKNSSKPINYGRIRGILFICYLFISSTNSLFLAVSSTQADDIKFKNYYRQQRSTNFFVLHDIKLSFRWTRVISV